ncbi:MAG TPA: sulfotransferase [Actinomycetota bacterium]|nr:sulfotransferase [Actinomycetota bacterium]
MSVGGRTDPNPAAGGARTARLPTFITIGAAKAGTTALYWYLAEHPQVFMSPMKETNFFAYGLDERGGLLYGDPDHHHFRVRTWVEYEALFAGARDELAVGEISPIYLECPQAAGRIRDRLPGAAIVCGLRDPVDRAYSDYQMYLRRKGRSLDPARDLTSTAEWARPDSHWMAIGRYHEMLSRYYEVFPRERIHVFLFDDLRRDTLGVVRELYRSLGVDPDFRPDLETPHNVGGMPASRVLERLLTSHRLQSMLEPLIPKRAVDRIRRVRTRNLRRAPGLPAGLRAELIERFRDDIGRTSELVGRDLSAWLEPPERPATPPDDVSSGSPSA